MIRWRFVLTRLIVVVAVLMLLRWGLSPMAEYVTVKGLQSTTGAKAEIGRTRVGLFPPHIQYSDVRIADPRDGKEMRDAFAADTIDLVIDGDALLRRRWVVDRGRITGLKIGSQRTTSGHLEQEESEPVDEGPSALSVWLSNATDQVGDRAEQIGKDLETVRTGNDIRRNWEAQYDELAKRTKDLEARIKLIRDTARGIDNPLRDWPEMEKTLAEAKTVREQLLAVRQEMDALPDKMRSDLQRMDAARRADLAKLDQYVPGNLADSQNFGVDLIAGEVRRQLQQLRDYLDSGRTLANYTVVAPEAERIRGENFDFLGSSRRPDMLIRQCEVSGLMRADGKTYSLSGVVDNMTPQPELLDEPTHARLRLEGPETVMVDYIRDRRNGAEPLDRLTMHWPQMIARPMELRGGKNIGMSIAGGDREVWLQLDSRGDALHGRIVSKQVGVNIRLDLRGDAAQSTAAIALNDSLATVDRIEIDAAFEGTWRDLDLQMNTNLGRVFKDAATVAITKQLDASKAKLAAKVDQVHQEQLLSLREWMTKRQTETQALLAKADQSIEEMSQKVLSEVGDADRYLGKLRTGMGKSLR